jgi:hypothetical protein
MKNSDFKKEWDEVDFINVNKAIVRHFGNKTFRTHHRPTRFFKRSFAFIDRVIGFAYTSTGVYACYGICNDAIYSNQFPGLKYEFIIVGVDGVVYAELWDENENATHVKM